MNRFAFVTPSTRLFSFLCLGAVLGVLASCDRVGKKVQITETREISPYTPSAQADIPSAQRFYDDQTDAAGGRDLVRFAFCKTREVIADGAARLARADLSA